MGAVRGWIAHWWKQNWIAFDQLCNTFFCHGWADETMSSVSYRMDRDGYPAGRLRPVIDWVALHVFNDPYHCQSSYISEQIRSQLPPELRAK